MSEQQAQTSQRPESNLRQISTERRRREPLPLEETEAYKSREAKGWVPQSEASGVFPAWWEQRDQ